MFHQPPGFVDPAHPNKVYKVIKALYGLHLLLELATTPIESNKPLVKDEDGVDVDKIDNYGLCKKQTIVENSTTEAEYVAAANCDEGDASERPSDSPPIPSPPHPSEDEPQIQPDLSPRPSPTTHLPDSILEGSGGNHRGQSSNDASLSGNEDSLTLQSQEAKERSQTTYHTSQSLNEDKIGKEDFSKETWGLHGVVIQTGRKFVKSFKGEPSVHKDPAFDDLDNFVDVDDTLDYMESKDAQNEGRTSSVVLEEKESANEGVSTEAPVSTVKPNKGTDKKNEGTDKQDGSTDSTKVSTDRQGKGNVLIMRGKVTTQTALTTTSTPTSTPTPTIFGDDETIAQLANDEEMARKVQEEWEAEEEKKRSFSRKKREVYIEQRAKFIHCTIVAQRKFIAQQRKKHSELKTKTFEEIQVLYERLKRQDQNFVAIGSAEDERQIKEINEESKDPKKKRLKKRVVNEEDTTKVPAKQEATKQDSEIMERKSFIARLNKVSSPDRNYLVIYRVNGHFRAFNYLMEIMMESSKEENDQGDFWNNQQEWEIVRWRLYEACGVCILELKDGTVIYMLVERRYPLSKELLQQMIDLGLEVEEDV
ncbi:hypothetical protein Tco_0001280 [Tanacetum coccineum]